MGESGSVAFYTIKIFIQGKEDYSKDFCLRFGGLFFWGGGGGDYDIPHTQHLYTKLGMKEEPITNSRSARVVTNQPIKDLA